MSSTGLEAERTEPGRRPGFWHDGMIKTVNTVVWAVANTGLIFFEQLCSLLAPAMLFAGIIWWAVPRILQAITLEGQAAGALQTVRDHVPREVFLGGDYYSADSLIWDGLLCIAVVAICRTLQTLLANFLLEQGTD